jgi:hypothetical protein
MTHVYPAVGQGRRRDLHPGIQALSKELTWLSGQTRLPISLLLWGESAHGEEHVS